MPEQRTAVLNLTASPQTKRVDSDYYVEGYATTFEPYVLYSDGENAINEQISRNAFDKALMDNIIMQYDHAGPVMARVSNNTLGVEVDEHGLFVWADLSKTASARNLYEEIKSGMVNQMSWAFDVYPDGRTFDERSQTIHINKVWRVYDVSAVSIPANDQTEISARDFVKAQKDKAKSEVQRERRKKKLTLRTKL